MAVFISYSHSDAKVVDILGARLFKEQMPVCLDRWELNLGDSLIRRVEEAITEAVALSSSCRRLPSNPSGAASSARRASRRGRHQQ